MDWLAPQDAVSAWTHGLWMLASFPAGAFLVWQNRRDAGRAVAMTIFSASLAVCFGCSAFYHAARPGPARDQLHVLDYLGIFLLIAGSATPVAVVVLRGWWRRWLLAQVWLLAVVGIGLRLTVVMPQWAYTTIYIGMGWVGVVTYFELASRLSHAGVRPMWLGGLCYTLGAVLEYLRWPDPWPGVFGHHEIFHLWVMAGAAFHYYLMLAVLTPYRPSPVAPRTAGRTSPAVDGQPDPVHTRRER